MIGIDEPDYIDGAIEFTDYTLREAGGDFSLVKQLMISDGAIDPWMLETQALVETDDIASSFLLHFWNDGKVEIMSTDRVDGVGMGEDDIRYLKQWSELHGWQIPTVSDDLLSDQRSLLFWKKMHNIAAVQSDKLDKKEQEEMEKLQYILEGEEEEDDVD